MIREEDQSRPEEDRGHHHGEYKNTISLSFYLENIHVIFLNIIII